MNNVESFGRLDQAIEQRGRPFTREEVSSEPLEPKNEVVGLGLERELAVKKTYNNTHVTGILSVQALIVAEQIFNPFGLAIGLVEDTADTKWMVRTRLAFKVPRNNSAKIDAGEHSAAITCYLMPDAPAALDRYAQDLAELETADYANDPEFDLQGILADPGIVQQWRSHDLPGNPGYMVLNGNPQQNPRSGLLQEWFHTSPEADGMALLSPTILGMVYPTELPRTIDWLLREE